MTKLELVKSAIAHRHNDKVPYAINLAGDAIEAYSQRILDELATEKIKTDLAENRITLSEALSLSLENCVINISCPWWDWHNLSEEYSGYDAPTKLPDTIGYGSYEAFFKKVKYIKENYDVYVLVGIWGSHWEKAYFARGIENFLGDIAGEPEFAQSLLDMIIRKNIVMLENILTCEGIDCVLLGSDWGTQRDLIMSPTAWRTMIKAGEQKEYDLIKSYGKDVFIHSCGNIELILPDLCEMGVNVLNPVQPECMDNI